LLKLVNVSINETLQRNAEEKLKSQTKINVAQQKIELSTPEVQVAQTNLREEVNICNTIFKKFKEAEGLRKFGSSHSYGWQSIASCPASCQGNA